MKPSFSVKEIESVVKEQGLNFVIVKEDVTDDHKIAQLRSVTDTVWYLTPQYLNLGTQFKAMLLYHKRQYEICNNDVSIPSIRKWIQGNTERECNICYEYNQECAHCAQCGFRYCPICAIKIIFKDIKYVKQQWNTIDYYRSNGLAFSMKCPQCKGVNSINLLCLYFRVMDKLDCFTQDQQLILRHLADNDPQFHTRINLRNTSLMNEILNAKSNSKAINKPKQNDKQDISQQVAQQPKPLPKKKKRRNKKKKQKGWKKGFLL